MIHPDTRLKYIDDEIGYGLFATRPIPRGTITWVLDAFDKIYMPQQVESMGSIHQSILEKYSYRNRKGESVLCWDFGRYVNHSFRSNCMSTGYDFEIAIRDIEAGEELTNDYGYLNLDQPFKARYEGTDREWVYPDDLPRYYKQWDEQVRLSFPLIREVDQPLMPLLSEELRIEIQDVIDGKRELQSILTHYFHPAEVLN